MGRIFIALAAIALSLIFQFEASSYPRDAARMPDLIGYLVMLLAVMAIVKEVVGWRDRAPVFTLPTPTWPSRRETVIGSSFIALIVVYVAALPLVGYLVATATFLLLPMAVLRPTKLPVILLTIVLVLAVVWGVFVGFLGLPIPFFPGE